MNIQSQIRSQEKMSRGRFRVHSFGGADLKNCLEGDLGFILVVVAPPLQYVGARKWWLLEPLGMQRRRAKDLAVSRYEQIN